MTEGQLSLIKDSKKIALPPRLPTLCSPLTHAIDKGRAAVPNSLNQCDERKN